MGSALAFGVQLLTQLPGLISAGMDVISLVNKGRDKLKQFETEKRDPTPEEWAELNSSIDALRNKLHSDG